MMNPSLVESDVFHQLPKEAQQALGRYAQSNRGWVWVEGRWVDSLNYPEPETLPFLPVDHSVIIRATTNYSESVGIHVQWCSVSHGFTYELNAVIQNPRESLSISGPSPIYVSIRFIDAIFRRVLGMDHPIVVPTLGKATSKGTLKSEDHRD